MMRRARLPLAVATLTLLIACQSDNLTRSMDGPMYAVSDGAHDGNPDFFFLTPLFKNPTNDPNFEPAAFNAHLRPAVEICQLGPLQPDNTRSCVDGPLVKRFAGSEIGVSAADQEYHVNWNTDESSLSPDQYYRISVLVGGVELGFADVDPVSTGKELKNVQTGEFIGLVDGRTLPIKFRIENGALCDAAACGAATINLPDGGSVELAAEGELFRFDVPPETEATFGDQTITDVTFNIEVCDGIDVDLRKFGLCLRVTTFFEATAGSAELLLNNPVVISMCVLEPGIPPEQEPFITLHQQDGDLVRALPHAEPNCETIGARTQGASGFAARGWRWIRDIAAGLFTPQPLYARSRMVVFDVGGGGETRILGAECTSSQAARHMALVECSAAVAPQLAAAATVTAPKTVSDFQFALPAKMDYVDPDDASRSAPAGTSLATAVMVTDWEGAPVQGAVVTFTQPAIEGPGIVLGTATSDADGIAAVSWPIAAGANSLVASGRGIAAQNNYPDATVRPFMPDIHSTDEQAPVILRIGAIPFTATGTLPDLIVESFTQSPVEPTTADLITFTAVIKNVGDGAAGPSTAGIDVGGEPAPGQTFAVPALAAGATFTVERRIVLDVAQGYVNFARADVANAVTESDEENNEQSLTFVVTAAAAALDQQNLLDGSLGGQGIGRFNDNNGAPDPDGTSFDFQDAQTFTVGISGQLTQIKVPLINLSGATTGVTLQIVAVVGGVPDEGSSLGEVTIPAAAISTSFDDVSNPAAWATFDLTSLEINVDQGQALAFIVRTLSTSAYLYNPEFTSGYANGSGYRRNRALTATWSNSEADFGFQTFVLPN